MNENNEPKSLSERMEDVSRKLVDAGLVDKEQVIERYRKLQQDRDEGFVSHEVIDVESTLGSARDALAEARKNLEELNKKSEDSKKVI